MGYPSDSDESERWLMGKAPILLLGATVAFPSLRLEAGGCWNNRPLRFFRLGRGVAPLRLSLK